MGRRRQARECALQILYMADFQHQDPAVIFPLYWAQNPVAAEVISFAEELVTGTWKNRTEIDAVIEKHSQHWKLHRMPGVDRNLLRLGVFELLHGRGVAPRVVLNEMIDIAKRFGTEESGAFVNGVLDPIAKEMMA